jgi:hypothetical protein
MSNSQDPASPSDFEELEPLPELSGGAGGPPSKGTATAEAPRAPEGIEKAPLMLQKAALGLLVASLLPWFVPEGFELMRLGAKAIVLFGAWFAYCGVEYAHGKKTPLDGLGKAHKLALPSIALVIMLAGVVVGGMSSQALGGVVESVTVMVAAMAWCQVHGYALGGKFNPSWAMVIPLLGLGALVNAPFVLMSDSFDGAAKGLVALGSLGVLGAGGFAGYTLFLAIKEAKAHGEAKKRAQAAARGEERRRKRDAQ